VIRRVWSAPSVRFFAIGVAIFAVYAARPKSTLIQVSPSLAQALVTEREREVGHPLTEVEQKSVLEHWVEEEVLFREALSRKLDRSDPIVRRRLIQAMRFVLEEEEGEPSAAELKTFAAAHAEKFTAPATVSFEQVFVGSGDVAAVRAALSRGVAFDSLGQAFPTGPRFEAQTRELLAGAFGSEFGARVFSAAEGEWTEVSSAYGRHLVRVTARSDAVLPPIEHIAGPVRAAMRDARRAESVVRQVAALRANYAVETP